VKYRSVNAERSGRGVGTFELDESEAAQSMRTALAHQDYVVDLPEGCEEFVDDALGHRAAIIQLKR